MIDEEKLARIIAKMQFTAYEYTVCPLKIIEEAKGLVRNAIGAETEEDEAVIEKVLGRSYSERKIISVVDADFPNHMKDGDEFKVCLDSGLMLSGKARITPKVLSVEMLSPYPDHMIVSEIQMLAPRIWTLRPEAGSEAGEECLQKMIELLATLYYDNIPKFEESNHTSI